MRKILALLFALIVLAACSSEENQAESQVDIQEDTKYSQKTLIYQPFQKTLCKICVKSFLGKRV